MEYLIKVSALIVLLYLGYTVFLKKETFFNHNRWFLLVGLVAALILPLIVIPIYISVEPISISEIPTDFIIDNSTDIVQETSFDWSQLLTLIYAIGVIICLTQFVLQFGSLLILLLKNAKNKDGIYTYVIVKNRISPFSFFKWIVYNPNLFSNEELQLIINHEKVHVRQWHSLDIVLSRLACVFFWFNPLMWFYHKDIQQNLEYIADENAQNSSDSEKNYQHLLLKTSVGNNNSNLTSNFYNSLIKKRIVMLQKSRSKSVNRWKSIFILPLFAIFLMSFNTEEVFIEVEKPLVENLISEITPDYENLKLIEIIFSKDTSDEEIQRLKAELKAQDIDMIIKNIKRNKKGEIIKINISFESKNSSTNYSVSDNNAIAPFYFKLDDNNNMSVGAFKNEIIEVEEQEIIEVIEEPQVIEEIIEVIEEEEEEGNRKKTKTFVIRQNGNTTKITGDTIHIIESNPKIKGKYIFRTKDSIVVGKPNTTYTFKSNGNVKVNSKSFTIKTDSVNYKNTFRFRGSEDKNPIYIVNGKIADKKKLKKISPNKIDEITVIKGDNATTLYGKKAKDGVTLIKTKGKESKKKNPWTYNVGVSKVEFIPSSTKEEAEIFIKSANKPLIIVNGETLGNINIKGLDPNVIGEINIIKGDKAIEMYGDKAKNGALVIFTKDEVEKQKINTNKKYSTEISAVGYVDDKNPEEKMVLYFISKMTPKSIIDKHISQLKSDGITAKFSKLKRNKSGEIVKIKVSLKDDDGNSSSATFENKNGIPQINFGKQAGILVVSSKKF